MKDVLIIFIVLLVLLTLISTFGGSIRQKEKFYEVPKVPDVKENDISQLSGIPMGLPPPPPEIAALLASTHLPTIEEKAAAQPAQEAKLGFAGNNKVPSVASMLSSEVQSVMPQITTLGMPQNAIPAMMMSGLEKFENVGNGIESFQIEAFDNIDAYAAYNN